MTFTSNGLFPAMGGTGTASASTPTTFTTGSVIFAKAGYLAQDNAKLFWDDTFDRLGIGTASPAFKAVISSSGTGANGSCLALDESGTRTWVIGAGFTNNGNFSIYNNGLSTNAVMFSGTTNNASFTGKILGTTTETIDIYTFGASNRYGLGVNAAKTSLFYNSAGSGLSFGSWDGTTYTEKVSIDTNGTIITQVAGNQLSFQGGSLFVNSTNGSIIFKTGFGSKTYSLQDSGSNTRLSISFDTGLITTNSTTMIASSQAFTNGAAAAAGTLLNAPAAGNPTKWIPINDNGTTRYIPAW